MSLKGLDVYRDDIVRSIITILGEYREGLSKTELARKVCSDVHTSPNKVYEYYKLLRKEGFIYWERVGGKGGKHLVKLAPPDPEKFFRRLEKFRDRIDEEKLRAWKGEYERFLYYANTVDEFILDLAGYVYYVLSYTAYGVQRQKSSPNSVSEGEIALDLFLFGLVPQLTNILAECAEKLWDTHVDYVEELREATRDLQG